MNSSNKHNNRWRQEDITFLQENYGKISLEDIGEHLGKTPMAVRLYVLRHRLDDRHQVIKENRLKKLLEYRFRHLEDFTPSKFFYKETGINQVRYWDLFFGREPITPKEYRAVANYFGITKTEAFGTYQLDLFGQQV